MKTVCPIPRGTVHTNLSQTYQEDRPVRYTVICLSDGIPTPNQDAELLCGDAVTRIRNLSADDAEVRVNTVHVFSPTLPSTCGADAGLIMPSQPCGIPLVTVPGVCPIAAVNESADRLRRMATLGGGAFLDFRDSQPVSLNGLFP